MEVCVDSVASAINAADGGAVRLELCSNLLEGGTTPSIGTLQVIKERVSIPVFVMIRPRGGDFMYTEDEVNVMVQDIVALKTAGADGFVFGILTINGTVDKVRCKALKEYARPLPVTFHRAIDMTQNIHVALETVISLGFERVLTSGGDTTALEGLPTICEMVRQAKGRITVMPGGGITDRNIERLLAASHATEFHCSARSSMPSKMAYRKDGISMGASFSPPEYGVKVTDRDKVQRLVAMATAVWDNGT